MPDEVPDAFEDILQQDSFAHVATNLPDGSPHVTPVWVDYAEDSGEILFNTVRGRRKERNLRSDSRVAMSVLDPNNPYRHVTVQGDAVELTTDGAVEHIDSLAGQYLGTSEYPNHDDEANPRVLVRVQPDDVRTMHRPKPTPSGMARYSWRRLRERIGLT